MAHHLLLPQIVELNSALFRIIIYTINYLRIEVGSGHSTVSGAFYLSTNQLY